MTQTEIPPLDVNIVSGTLDIGEKRPKEYRETYKTVILNAANPYQQLAGSDPARVCLTITFVANNVVISGSIGQASDLANTNDATLASPNGSIVANTNGSFWDFKGQNEIWVSSPTFPTRVSYKVLREI